MCCVPRQEVNTARVGIGTAAEGRCRQCECLVRVPGAVVESECLDPTRTVQTLE